MSQGSNTVRLHEWLDTIPESIVAHVVNRVSDDAERVIGNEDDLDQVLTQNDEGLMKYYNALVLAYNEKIGGELSLEEFLFDDSCAQYVVDELGEAKIKQMYGAFTNIFGLPKIDILEKLKSDIATCGKMRTMLSFCLEDTERFYYFLHGSQKTRFEQYFILSYIDNEVSDWRVRLKLLKVFEGFFLPPQGLLSDAIVQSSFLAVEKGFQSMPSKGLQWGIDGFQRIDEVSELNDAAEYLALGCWIDGIKTQIKEASSVQNRVELLEGLYDYVGSLQIAEESPNDEIADRNNLMLQYQNEVVDIAGEYFSDFFSEKGMEKISQESVGYFIDLHKILFGAHKKCAIVTEKLKYELREFLKKHPEEYKRLRDNLAYDNGMQRYLDFVLSKNK